MTNFPNVSVILTSYNQGQYIKQCIESILAQTYGNFEFIISDDCSSDNSIEVIKSFSDERIRLNITDENKGGTMLNLESCMHLVTGKYIAIAHSDDLWSKDKLEKQIKKFEERPDLGAVFTLAEMIDAENNVIGDNNAGLFFEFNGTQAQWLQRFFF